MRAVCGCMKSDYSFSAGIVYNNFPWPVIAGLTSNLDDKVQVQCDNKQVQHDKASCAIEAAAQAELDARAIHTSASIADLYDPLTMPANLLKAHQVLDKAVDAAYGYKGANTDAARVAFLFERYQALTSLLPVADKPKKRRKL